MTKVLELLKGKKSYVVGVATIGYGIYLHFFGDHLPWEEVVDYIFGGAGFMTIRAALDKVGLNGTS